MWSDSQSEVKAESKSQASKEEFIANIDMEDNLLHIPGFDVGSFIHALENWKKKGS